MANDSMITFEGWVGTKPTERLVGETTVATFRVGSTTRRWNKELNNFVDTETNWFTVNAWRALGRNCLASLKKGDPVTVHGKLRAQVYEQGERTVHSVVVEAVAVGHDLTWGSSRFRRTTSRRGVADDTELRALNAELGADGPQISSDGRTIDDLVTPVRREIPVSHDESDSADEPAVPDEVAPAGSDSSEAGVGEQERREEPAA